MLRSGGAIMNISFTPSLARRLNAMETLSFSWLPVAQRQKYIFGWPASGGVWVLTLPPYVDRSGMTDDEQLSQEIEQMLIWDKIVDDVWRDFDGRVHYGDLVRAETMEEFCERLEGKGAVFYERIGESGEVREMGLLDEESAFEQEVVDAE